MTIKPQNEGKSFNEEKKPLAVQLPAPLASEDDESPDCVKTTLPITIIPSFSNISTSQCAKSILDPKR